MSMPKTYNTEPVKQALQNAQTVLILLPQNPPLDAVAAGLALYLALTKSQLNTIIGCTTEMTVNFNRLFGVDKIKPRIGNQNLVISFAYPEDSLEKVSYDKDLANKKFNLTIEPKAGMLPLDPGQVEYSHTGSNADLIFVIGVRSLEDLGHLYQQEKKLLDDKQKTLVNLSHLDKNAQFGTVNLYDPTVSGSSEITFTVLKALGLPIKQDIATNLLAGIESATNNLTTASSADTFEVIAQLMRLGAKKGHLAKPQPLSSRPFGLSPAVRAPSWSRAQAPSLRTIPTTSSLPPTVPPPPLSSPPTSAPATPSPTVPSPAASAPVISQTPVVRPIPSNQTQVLSTRPTQTRASQPSPDWLKPKVVTTSGSKI